jgi:hypothetical protein
MYNNLPVKYDTHSHYRSPVLSSRSQLYVSATLTSIKICIQDESILNLDGIPTTLSEVFIIFLLFQMNVILVL